MCYLTLRNNLKSIVHLCSFGQKLVLSLQFYIIGPKAIYTWNQDKNLWLVKPKLQPKFKTQKQQKKIKEISLSRHVAFIKVIIYCMLGILKSLKCCRVFQVSRARAWAKSFHVLHGVRGQADPIPNLCESELAPPPSGGVGGKSLHVTGKAQFYSPFLYSKIFRCG